MRRATTIALAIVAGIAVALVVRSELAARARESALLDAITAEDPNVRRSGWAEIPEGSDEKQPTLTLTNLTLSTHAFASGICLLLLLDPSSLTLGSLGSTCAWAVRVAPAPAPAPRVEPGSSTTRTCACER